MKVFAGLDELAGAEGTDLGAGEWMTVDQKMIDGFAETTGDHQWIHVDPERAAKGPFGATIAHGFLTLSMTVALTKDLMSVDNVAMGINYGLDRVRFITPVKVGSRVRAGVVLTKIVPIEGGLQVTRLVTVEIEGAEKPACVAESLVRFIGAPPAS